MNNLSKPKELAKYCTELENRLNKLQRKVTLLTFIALGQSLAILVLQLTKHQ